MAIFGGYVKPSNNRENRRDHRLIENQTGKRRVVVVMRERNGRSLPFVFKGEGQAIEAIAKHVATGSIVHADEAVHWDVLHALYLTKRINHQEAYSNGEACTKTGRKLFLSPAAR